MRICRVGLQLFASRDAEYYGLDASRIPICYEGSDHIKAQPADEAVLDRLHRRDRPYFLGVGIYTYNKNLAGPSPLCSAPIKRRRAGCDRTTPRRHSREITFISDDKLIDTGHITDGELRRCMNTSSHWSIPPPTRGSACRRSKPCNAVAPRSSPIMRCLS